MTLLNRPLRIYALMALLFAPLSLVQAQSIGVVQSEILVLDMERLFAQTQLGQRISEDLQAQRDALIVQNRRIEAELEAEELALTVLRAEKTSAEFRKLADAFDDKVRGIRGQSERRARDLELSRERAPVIFLRSVENILGALMRDAGGIVVLDKRSVLLSADVVDITPLAILRINQGIGRGPEELRVIPPVANDKGSVAE